MSLIRKMRRNMKKMLSEVKLVGINHPVHGYFVYECEKCGAVYVMYLDKGLEDSVQDGLYPEKHKPVPFLIGCKHCNHGLCKHIFWEIGDSDEYIELPEGANYFKNTPKEECGKPIIVKPDFQNIESFKIALLRGCL